MKVSELKYKDYYLLNTVEQMIVRDLAYQKETNFYEVEPMLWTWGQVKETQDLLNENITYQDILKIVQFECPKMNENSSALLVLKMFKSIQDAIEQITQGEINAMAYQQTPKEIAASEAVGGFEKFGTYPQTLSMVGVVAPSVKEVEALEYGYVFQAMVFKHVQGQYEKQLYK